MQALTRGIYFLFCLYFVDLNHRRGLLHAVLRFVTCSALTGDFVITLHVKDFHSQDSHHDKKKPRPISAPLNDPLLETQTDCVTTVEQLANYVTECFGTRQKPRHLA